MKPCMYGLKCPHLGWSDEGDMMCCWPLIVGRDSIDGELFTLVESVDCQICEVDSELYDILDAYSDPKVKEAIAEYKVKEEERLIELWKKMDERSRIKRLIKETEDGYC